MDDFSSEIVIVAAIGICKTCRIYLWNLTWQLRTEYCHDANRQMFCKDYSSYKPYQVLAGRAELLA
jgi:hypothetical protein